VILPVLILTVLISGCDLADITEGRSKNTSSEVNDSGGDIAENYSNGVESIDYFSCVTDEDCIMVDDGCCGCTAGGRATFINRIYEDEWNEKLREECEGMVCPTVISDHSSCILQPECSGGTCQIQMDGYGKFPYYIVKLENEEYVNNVYVRLSEDQTQVTAYPDIQDVRGEDWGYAELSEGYYAGTWGPGKTGILSVSKSEYMALESTPYSNELLDLVIDFDPFVEVYECTVGDAGPLSTLNFWSLHIEEGTLEEVCERVL